MDFCIHRLMRTLVAVSPAAAVFACLAAPVSGAAPRGTWMMADLNGDRKVDLVTVVATNLAGEARRHELQVQLNAPHVPAAAVPRFVVGDRLHSRDLDGDSDRDIILTTAFGELIAVWLNDGAGNFQEGSVDSFRFQFSRDDRRSLDAPERPVPASQIGEYPSRDAVSQRYASFDPRCPAAILTVHEASVR